MICLSIWLMILVLRSFLSNSGHCIISISAIMMVIRGCLMIVGPNGSLCSAGRYITSVLPLVPLLLLVPLLFSIHLRLQTQALTILYLPTNTTKDINLQPHLTD
ncbi:Os03g0333050 [Oryza sativa Japonica Group]|uniref:Os03g0333050 protein n=1 Tax=Oryza sativa subsp. japonica TaxID=39947 RepID=A0A0P0VX39_ORYSJ|nr:hypothetical protein EE612_017220 [Oryza sativa]BAS84048.1 Os03g0333050 [Oryza sativa Japonica Group]